MEMVLLWVVCGLAAAVVGSSKDRSGVGWFFMGILLGPIALLMVGFMPKGKPQKVAVSDTRKCPFCAEDIKAAAIVCKHCGRDIEPLSVEDVTLQAQPPKEAALYVKCPYCGDLNVEGAEECRTCMKPMTKG